MGEYPNSLSNTSFPCSTARLHILSTWKYIFATFLIYYSTTPFLLLWLSTFYIFATFPKQTRAKSLILTWSWLLIWRMAKVRSFPRIFLITSRARLNFEYSILYIYNNISILDIRYLFLQGSPPETFTDQKSQKLWAW